MNTRRLLVGTLAALSVAATAAPASAAQSQNGRGQKVTPTLLSDTTIDWASGEQGWVHLSWTSPADLDDVRVTVTPLSADLLISYPENQADYTAPMVDADLSSNEIDFTAFHATTSGANNGTKWAELTIEWSVDGERHSADLGRIQFTNKFYEGEDFAILTDDATATSDPNDPGSNWIELGYRGLSPVNANLGVTVQTDAEVYHPQGTHTSLHHDSILRGGEKDVARVWIDPGLLTPGTHTLDVIVTYDDFKGQTRTLNHTVTLTVE